MHKGNSIDDWTPPPLIPLGIFKKKGSLPTRYASDLIEPETLIEAFGQLVT